MAGNNQSINEELRLPARLVTRRDVLKAARELERLRDQLISSKVSGREVHYERLSESLQSLLDANGISQLTEENISEIKQRLEKMVDRLPVLRFAFAGEPDAKFLKQLVIWIRDELHPAALLMYTVQPHLAGGFILTTDRRRYDMSWKAELEKHPLKLREVLFQ